MAPVTVQSELTSYILLSIFLSTPFLLAYLFSILTLPKGYNGIRNDQLNDKDRWCFELRNWEGYEVEVGMAESEE